MNGTSSESEGAFLSSIKENFFHAYRFQVQADHRISPDSSPVEKYFHDFHNLQGNDDGGCNDGNAEGASAVFTT